jgi:copper chaperone CopZ
VKRLMKGVPGIGEVRADSRSQKIDVLFDAAQVEPAEIAERLGEAGYETRVADGPVYRSDTKQTKSEDVAT